MTEGSISLMGLAQRARLGRQTARTCVAKGLLRPAPYLPHDAVTLRVAAACLSFDPPDPPGLGADIRNRNAVTLTEAYLLTQRPTLAAYLLVSNEQTVLALGTQDTVTAHERMRPATVLVLPIGAWQSEMSPMST